MQNTARLIAQKLRRPLGLILAFGIFIFNFTPEMATVRNAPCAVFAEADSVFSNSGYGAADPFLISSPAVTVSASGDESLGAKRLDYSLFGLIHLKSIPVYRSRRPFAMASGYAVGISINTDGVLIVGFGEVKSDDGRICCPAKSSGLRAGDLIISVNGENVYTSGELLLALNAFSGPCELTVERNGKRRSISVLPASCEGEMRIGAWVRDNTIGIGTLSFITEEGLLTAALGHAVVDADTGVLLPVLNGRTSEANILGVTRGRAGSPGELRGTFTSESPYIGSIIRNDALGVFGICHDADTAAVYSVGDVMEIAFPSEVHEGDAYIISQTDRSGPEHYSCRIIRTTKQSEVDQKGLVIEITDQRLIDSTGGIVQGMSGSPIIQDGRLAGVVTHVFVNDPMRGYGAYAYWMYLVAAGE